MTSEREKKTGSSYQELLELQREVYNLGRCRDAYARVVNVHLPAVAREYGRLQWLGDHPEHLAESAESIREIAARLQLLCEVLHRDSSEARDIGLGVETRQVPTPPPPTRCKVHGVDVPAGARCESCRRGL